MKKSELPSLGETVRLTAKCMKTMERYCPGFFWSRLCNDLALALNPYITIWLSARIIDELAGLRRPDVLWRLVIITIITEGVLAAVQMVLRSWENARNDSYHAERRRMFSDKMMTMDYADVDKQETSDRLARIMNNEYSVGIGMGHVVCMVDDIFTCIVVLIGGCGMMVSLFSSKVIQDSNLEFLNHPGFSLLLLGIMLGIIVANSRILNKQSVLRREFWECYNVVARLARVYQARMSEQRRALDIRIYDQQRVAEHYNQQIMGAFGTASEWAKWHAGPQGICKAMAGAASVLFNGLIYLFAGLKAWGGAFGVGAVTQYVGTATKMCSWTAKLLNNIGMLRSDAAVLRTIFEFLDMPNSMYQGSLTTEKRSDRQYDVEFRDVSFKYPGSEIWALRHVNMKFKVGSRLAIVGENGSGKTTFIKLLCRLYDPQEGQILLNGIDIRKYNYRDYMDIFSVVFQDFQLLSQPLGNNVAGSMEYDRDRARKALIDAGFGERLDTLPDGLDTQLYKDFGENGVEVSGGEAQKIAIARALYKDAPFIILDEPTASLDPVAEAEIYAKFNDISGDKTAIYISHRLSSCKFCDEVAVFHEGAVIQQGTHEALLADTAGKYHTLWHAQAQYYTSKA